jgi:hypothetical protein
MSSTTPRYIKPAIIAPVQGVTKFFLVEVIVNGVAGTGSQLTKITIQDQPYLRNKRIVGLEMYDATDFPVSPSQNPIIDFAQMQATFFTAYSDTPETPGTYGEWLQTIPAVNLHSLQNAATDTFKRGTFTLRGNVFAWDKCYFTLAAAYGNVLNLSVLMGVYFQDNFRGDGSEDTTSAPTTTS